MKANWYYWDAELYLFNQVLNSYPLSNILLFQPLPHPYFYNLCKIVVLEVSCFDIY